MNSLSPAYYFYRNLNRLVTCLGGATIRESNEQKNQHGTQVKKRVLNDVRLTNSSKACVNVSFQ